MDGLDRTVGVGPSIQLGGHTFTVQAKILRYYAEIEAEIKRLRGNPFDMLRQAMESVLVTNSNGEAVANALTVAFPGIMEQAKNWGFVGIDEMGNFLENTFHGRCFTVWMAVRNDLPQGMTRQDIFTLFADEYERQAKKGEGESWWQSITAAIDSAEGKDELGNSTGSLPTTESQVKDDSPGTSSTGE